MRFAFCLISLFRRFLGNTTPWERACRKDSAEKPKKNENDDFRIATTTGTVAGETNDKKTDSRTFKRPNSFATKPLASSLNKNKTVNNLDNIGKRKRRTTKLAQLSDDEDEIDVLKDYQIPKLSTKNSSTKTIKVTKRNALDDSQDDLYKCARCDKKFPEELYEEHTNGCLDESTISNT